MKLQTNKIGKATQIISLNPKNPAFHYKTPVQKGIYLRSNDLNRGYQEERY